MLVALILVAVQALVPAKELHDVKMVWLAPEDDWDAYILTHMQAIRAKYFPKNANQDVSISTSPSKRRALCSKQLLALCI
jgi:hypothetical protein